jgi:hypothetical protein
LGKVALAGRNNGSAFALIGRIHLIHHCTKRAHTPLYTHIYRYIPTGKQQRALKAQVVM